MANNFDLRSFLTENKLTKNSQLLKEEGFKTFQDSGIEGLYMDTVNGVKIYSATDSSVSDYCAYILEYPDGKIDIVDLDVSGQPISSEELQEYDVLSDKPEIADFISRDIANELGQEGGEENLDEAQFSDSYDTPAAKKVHGQLRDIVDIFQKSRNEEEQEVEAAIQAAEQETGSQVTPTEKSVLLQQARWIRMHDTEMEREGTENKKPIMKETKLTAKERRLVEMVQKAMKENTDISTYTYEPGQEEDEYQDEFNPADAEDEKDYRRDQYRGNQIPEGEDMVQEKPLPKYSSIEELMKEIEHGTNEAACKYKMEEMKRIYEALEAKVGSLEEGEHAEHIDQKAVKQMRKDIAALRKAEERLRKDFDKKFNKKEKPAAAPKKEKEPVALAEGTFDLRKFLTENKITRNSRMLNENADISREDFIRGLAAKLKQQGFPNVSEILNDKTGMGSFDQGAWYSNTSDCMLDDEVIEEVEPIISDYCDEKGVEFIS